MERDAGAPFHVQPARGPVASTAEEGESSAVVAHDPVSSLVPLEVLDLADSSASSGEADRRGQFRLIDDQLELGIVLDPVQWGGWVVMGRRDFVTIGRRLGRAETKRRLGHVRFASRMGMFGVAPLRGILITCPQFLHRPRLPAHSST